MEFFIFLFVIILISLIIACAQWNGNASANQVNNDYVHIDNIRTEGDDVAKVFSFFKKVFFEKNIELYDIVRDIDLRREYNQIKSLINTFADNSTAKMYADGMNLTLTIGSIGTDFGKLILNPKETPYFSTKLCAVDTIQRIGKNVSYSGLRGNINGIRSGVGTIYTSDIEQMTRFDAGLLVITNQRIIFKGTKKNKTIPIGNILTIDNFDNNGVIITTSDRETPIVFRFVADKCFYRNLTEMVSFFYNDLNYFYRGLEKAFYDRNATKEQKDARKTADDTMLEFAHYTMVQEGLEK